MQITRLVTIAIASLLLVSAVSATMSAIVSIPDRFSTLEPGDTLYFETEIKWPTNEIRQDLIIEYRINTRDGEEVAYLKVLKAIETQASFMDTIVLPENLDGGTYVLSASIQDYEEFSRGIAVSFTVTPPEKSIPIEQYLLIILVAVGFIGIVVSIELYLIIREHHDDD